MIVSLDLVQTLALAAVVFVVGVQLKKYVPLLERLSIPAAVIGGVGFAVVNLFLHDGVLSLSLDTSAQSLFMIAFFTSIGMSASLDVLKKGGVPMIALLAIATAFGFMQNLVGVATAFALDVHPLLGVMAGSLTMLGGPATGMAFAELFRNAGVEAAGVVAITAATVGILFGGLVGGPIGARLIRKNGLTAPAGETREDSIPFAQRTISIQMNQEGGNFSLTLLILGGVMGVGSLIGYGMSEIGWTLPAYIGAMIVGAAVRNLLDARGSSLMNVPLIQFLGGVSLNIFLVIALMNLQLWELVNLAIPLTVILTVQIGWCIVVLLTAGLWLFGRDYDAAIVAGGFAGFVLGTTANAVANMQTLSDKYGFAPRAFLIVPVVGGFFIDFTNAVMINIFLNWFS
jgi:ESS family glutamate:Na+ symporter